jgi:DNA-binding CsgD family transcriptional regulator
VDPASLETAFLDAVVDPARWTATLEMAAAATESMGAVLFPIRGRLPNVPHSRSMERSFETYLRDGWIARDQRYRVWPAVAQRGVATDLDYTTHEAIARDPYYQEFLAPHGLRWFAAVPLACDEEVWILSLQRTIAQGPFSTAEQHRLAGLSRSLSGVAALAHALGRARTEAALSAFEVSGTAVVLVDRLGEVLTLNAGAEALLGPDVKIRQKRLVSSCSKATAALDRALRALLWSSDPAHLHPAVLLPREGRAALQAYPMRLPGLGRDALAPCQGVMVLVDPEARCRPAEAVLRAAFGFTPAEARLAAHLAAGTALDGAAPALGITYETARNHLKALFAKTGTHRQAELVSVLAGLPMRRGRSGSAG